MLVNSDISTLRREYGNLSLDEADINADPMVQFAAWFAESLKVEHHDPTAMVLSTVDAQLYPDSRVVLLKAATLSAFVFYSNYASAKALQIEANPCVALNFYWPETARQVRVRGHIKRLDAALSDEYFLSRPRVSQLSAIVSPQSSEISARCLLEESLHALILKYEEQPIVRPDYWGGYEVLPEQIEFWQGRDHRLHDRIQYYKDCEHWMHRRLAP